MKLEELPDKWKARVQRYLSTASHGYNSLSVADFKNDLRLNFEDGSAATFKWAFYLLDDENYEVTIFTEHCGCHIFPYCLERIETVDRNGSVISSESAVIR